MRLVRFRALGGAPTPGALLSDDQVLDLGAPACELPALVDPHDTCDLGGAWIPAVAALLSRLEQTPADLDALRSAGAVHALGDVQLLAPVPRPAKLICIGLNYKDHAEESGMDLPERPLAFSKFGSCVVGPDDDVLMPPGTEQVDYEAELAVVVGRTARRVSVADAMDHVLGYAAFNDVSARDFQFADGQWQRGKSCDTFAPLGPWLATKETLPDPHVLPIRFRLNGETLQDSNTDQLIHRVPELIAQLSAFTTLEPGDVIATGTPPGVGFARKPPVWVKAGDVMEVEIEGLGVLRNPVRDDREAAGA